MDIEKGNVKIYPLSEILESNANTIKYLTTRNIFPKFLNHNHTVGLKSWKYWPDQN